jgi:hypothetical protein
MNWIVAVGLLSSFVDAKHRHLPWITRSPSVARATASGRVSESACRARQTTCLAHCSLRSRRIRLTALSAWFPSYRKEKCSSELAKRVSSKSG